ncbi:MAG TPA: HDOD domain-containing protein [Polyangiaceae bacterium]|nr:HDOD domain-containing protein [Polyangiaceae bacterium]
MMKPAPEGWVNAPTRIEPVQKGLNDGDELSELIGQQIGNYVIESLLGQGGMAVVYLARHPALGREVAVKLLNPEYKADVDLNARFLQEARVTANFRHPNIVEIYDLGDIGGRAYYTMERLIGIDLATLVAHKGRFQPAEVADYFAQICRALEVAHQQGIVHRDLKPANIFVVDETPLRLKLMDFGIAKVTEKRRVNATQRGEVLGTPAYMAPEQALGHVEAISVATDLYALGIIAYEMLTGRLPFSSDSDLMLLTMQIRDQATPIREIAPDVPKAVADLIERCLSKEPYERPRSAKELSQQLMSAVDGASAASDPASAARAVQPARAPMAERAAPAAAAPPSPAQAPFQPVPVQPPPRSVARRLTGKSEPLPEPAKARELAVPSREPAVVPSKEPVKSREPAVVVSREPAKSRGPAVVPSKEPIRTREPAAAREPALVASREPAKAREPVVQSREPAKAREAAAAAFDDSDLDIEVVPASLETEPNADVEGADDADIAAAASPGEASELEASPQEMPPPVYRPEQRFLSEITDEPTGGQPLALGSEDGRVLDKLLKRMQRRADFPSFLNNVNEISRKADADQDYSAWQLSEAILKDFALTAKLLRMVNSLLGNRFGGKVFSVKQAVIILGFDSVRSMALGISVYKMSGQKVAAPGGKVNKFHEDLADEAINSLIAGEIARNLAFKAGIKDTELAMMCAMFRNLGQQLVIEYLPEEYQKIVALADSARISRSAAAQRVLNTTLPKIGLGVAERWNLPKLMRLAMASNPLPDAPLVREEDRLGALAKLANDLCHIIASGDRQSYKPLLQRLLLAHRRLLVMSDQDISSLLGTVCKSFEARYSALFGPYHRKSRFLFNARSLTGEPLPAEPRVAEPLSASDIARIEQAVTALNQGLQKRQAADGLIANAMQALATGLDAPRVILFTLTGDRKELEVRYAVGDDAGTLKTQLRVPVTQGGDIFSSALRSGKNVVVEDALGPGVMRRLPQRYFEVLGSAAFALYVCVARGYPSCLVLVDADAPEALPTRERVKATKTLRELVAKIAERK